MISVCDIVEDQVTKYGIGSIVQCLVPNYVTRQLSWRLGLVIAYHGKDPDLVFVFCEGKVVWRLLQNISQLECDASPE